MEESFYSSDSHKQFYLVDDTGKMLGSDTRADIDIPVDATFQGYIAGTGTFGIAHSPMDPRVLTFVDGLDDMQKRIFMNHAHLDVRVIEYYIADDDPLFVLGNAEPVEGKPSDIGYKNLILRKGNVDKTMYISDTGERQVIGKLSGSMYLQIIGGLGLSAICLLIMLMYFNI